MKRLLWNLVWATFFRPSPKPLSRFRNSLLRLFGAHIAADSFVASSARIYFPWKLTMEARACIGDFTEIYNLGEVILRARSTLAQHVYVCSGTHDVNTPNLQMMVAPIEVAEDAFVFARAMLLPGVIVGTGSIVGGGAVVAKDVAPWTIVAGNPAREISRRQWRAAAGETAS